MTDEIKPEKLFIVFSPDGPTPPVKTHPKHKEAAGAAWQMAKLHPGQTFYVMRKSGRPAFVEAPASVDRSGAADETSTKIEGSAEGESAVPKADAHD